jgi:hypothetical protein
MRTPVAVCALVVALLAIPATASASTPCWKDVIADWSKDNSVDGRYAPRCIRQAMVNAPTDLKIYSSLEDDLQSALRARSARRLAGVHAPAAASLAAPSGSSAVSPLVVVLGALGLLAVVGTGAMIVRRRRAGL